MHDRHQRTVLAIAAVAGLTAALAGVGCWLDPTCQDRCDGDAIARCHWRARGGHGKLDLPSSLDRETGRAFCPTGTTCAMVYPGNSRTAGPHCLPAPLQACPRQGRPTCDGPHRTLFCVETTAGWKVREVATAQCQGSPPRECRDTETGFACVEVP